MFQSKEKTLVFPFLLRSNIVLDASPGFSILISVPKKKIKKAEYFDNKEWANILKKEFTGEIINALKLSSAEKKPSSQQLIYNTEVNFFEKIGQLNAVFFENILSHYIFKTFPVICAIGENI